MLRSAICLAVALSALPGCFTVNADLPGTLRSDITTADVETAGRLDVQKGHTFLFWGLSGQPPPDFIATELQREVKAKSGDGIQNFEYNSEFGCSDLVLGTVTLGILAPRTFRFTGDIVRIRKPALGGGAAPTDAGAPPEAIAPPPAASY
jgi:hypothetical protein